MYILKFSYF